MGHSYRQDRSDELDSDAVGPHTVLTTKAQTLTTAEKEQVRTNIGAVSEGVPTGTVLPFAGSSAPSGYELCYGQAVSRSTFATLFGVISTTYGTGDGSTTFNLPDLRGRVVAGQDNMGGVSADRLTDQANGVDGDVLGDTGGTEGNLLGEGSGATTGGDLTAITDRTVSTIQPTIILNYIIKT